MAENERRAGENVHCETLYAGRTGCKDGRENGEPVALDLPITVAGSILNVRHGTRYTALIPEQGPLAKEKEKGMKQKVGVAKFNRMILEFSGQSASALHVMIYKDVIYLVFCLFLVYLVDSVYT